VATAVRKNADVRDYDDDTYGESFADVYDDWYHDISDIGSTIATLQRLARPQSEGDTPRAVELGVGTGRIAIPLAAVGVRVAGLDTSAAMLRRLADKPGGDAVHGVRGDMVDGLDAAVAAIGGPPHLVVVAYNTFFSLLTPERQHEAFAAVAARLADGGRFVIEAFVPAPADERARRAGVVTVKTIAADRVVLSVDATDPAQQRAEGQYIEFTEAGGVRLRPWAIRWSTPEQLDEMATGAGLELDERWSDFAGAPFDRDAERHVSVYRRRSSSPT
jgi:hypothetical protein